MKRGLFIVFALFCFHQGIGQVKGKDRSIVTYDPLFWKDKLNLDAYQSRRIRDINSTFYKQLIAVSQQERNDHAALRVKAEEQLSLRSEKIWETLYPRQRRKWEKILSENPVN